MRNWVNRLGLSFIVCLGISAGSLHAGDGAPVKAKIIDNAGSVLSR